MIFVKGTKWRFKKVGENKYHVTPITKGEGLRTFVYSPQGTFTLSKLKKQIRKNLKRWEKEETINHKK